ncbi:MAG: HAMP domain-containing histidine kinase [Gammaproteobacteria bacterium]|nr:HAMP domain-containing histidine kinase [Gammaproteobacteria bacterium]
MRDAARSAVPDKREQAIEAGLLTVFVQGTLFRQRVGAALMIVFVVFCWGHTDRAALLAWLAAGLIVLAVRNWRERKYVGGKAFDSPSMRAEFIQHMRPLYAVHGAIWGVSLLFCFDRIPLYDQMGCWLVLACVASAPLTSVSLVPRLLSAYTNPLFTLLILILVTLTTLRGPDPDSPRFLFLVLPLFFWWLLGRFGDGILRNQRQQFGLQYDIALKEQEARTAIETKDRFLAGASHDMRQPVMALSLYAEHLVEHPDMHLELAPKIAVASQSIKSMFESLFDLANLDSGQVKLNVQTFDATDAIQGLCSNFEPLAAAKNIELRVHAIDATLRSDLVQFKRMVGNVLGNAIKYTAPGKKILVAVRPHKGGARIEVWDQGFGIPAKDIDRVFQEFYRVDRADMPSIDGVGLGLSIVSRLSRVLNTRVAVSSVVGKGTRFTLRVSSAPLPGAESAR